MSDILNEAFLSRQPVVDAKQDIVGYRLSFLSGDDLQGGAVQSAFVCAAYADLGIRTALGYHQAFLPIDEHFLYDGALDTLVGDVFL